MHQGNGYTFPLANGIGQFGSELESLFYQKAGLAGLFAVAGNPAHDVKGSRNRDVHLLYLTGTGGGLQTCCCLLRLQQKRGSVGWHGFQERTHPIKVGPLDIQGPQGLRQGFRELGPHPGCAGDVRAQQSGLQERGQYSVELRQGCFGACHELQHRQHVRSQIQGRRVVRGRGNGEWPSQSRCPVLKCLHT